MATVAMMHFGSSQANFPHLWCHIPACLYLGSGKDDTSVILEMVGECLVDSFNH
ncbi:Uncharacterised protein [Psychrobacter phenylpyruvicus]|uniref:Uncharacterized protein n=1 Tax=Psychrobacter phenylpyruvicus TaxID=29432 RepID=A0A379LKC2_9GAMM|nr:Uncharacterised protein [Psychrobacter phenylpyruvicus]